MLKYILLPPDTTECQMGKGLTLNLEMATFVTQGQL